MGNLPQIAQLTFPDSDLKSQLVLKPTVYKTFDWDFDSGDFLLQDGKLIELTGIDYLKVWIQKALRTVKNTLIYEGTNYGSDHYSLIGQNFHPDFIKAELTRMISEALLVNDTITNVESFSFSQASAKLIVSFTVQSIYGITNQQVVI